MILMVLFGLIITGLSFKYLPIFAVGLVGLFLYTYPPQTLGVISVVFILYLLIKDKLP